MRCSKKDWVDYFFNSLLIIIAIFIIVLLFDPIKVIFFEYFPLEVSSTKSPIHCSKPGQLIATNTQKQNVPDLKNKLSIFSLVFALLSGIILKVSRDALEDIKKHSDLAKLLEKHKFIQFDYLRINQSTKVISKLAAIALARRVDGEITDENWTRKVVLEQIQVLYEHADSFNEALFDDKALQHDLEMIATDDGTILKELCQDSKINDFLTLLALLSQDRYPQLAQSARELHRALKKYPD